MTRKRVILFISVCAFLFLATFASSHFKSTTNAVHDVLAKECAEQFSEEILDGRIDDAMRRLGLPYHNVSGELLTTSLHKIQKGIESRIAAPDIHFKVAEVLTLDEYSVWANEHGVKDFDLSELTSYDEFMGENGRIVIVELSPDASSAIANTTLAMPTPISGVSSL